MPKEASAKKVAKKQGVEPPAAGADDLAAMSIRFPRSMHDRLRKLAFETRRPMLEFIVEGIELRLQADKY